MSIRSIAVAITLIGLLPAPGAIAGSRERAQLQPQTRRGAEILARVDRPEGDRSWLSTHLSRIRIHKRTGFAYVHSIDYGERGMQFKVLGPVMRKKKNLGLTFELRF